MIQQRVQMQQMQVSSERKNPLMDSPVKLRVYSTLVASAQGRLLCSIIVPTQRCLMHVLSRRDEEKRLLPGPIVIYD